MVEVFNLASKINLNYVNQFNCGLYCCYSNRCVFKRIGGIKIKKAIFAALMNTQL